MKIPFKCPVCEGRCAVPYSFYYPRETASTIPDSMVTCRSCHGSGIVYGDDGGPENPFLPDGLEGTDEVIANQLKIFYDESVYGLG